MSEQLIFNFHHDKINLNEQEIEKERVKENR